MMGDVVFSGEEYARLAKIVGSLMISQFDGDQKAYRSIITEIFSAAKELEGSVFAFDAVFAFGDGEEE
jgi:ATP-dependent 26S proteasome regulatory subunit